MPVGSNILLFSDSDKTSWFSLVENTLKSDFKNSVFTLNNFYDHYLAQLQKTNENPILVSINDDTIDVIDPMLLANKYIGQPVSQYSRNFVHKNLGAKICTEQKCHDNLDKQITKIENSLCLMILYKILLNI